MRSYGPFELSCCFCCCCTSACLNRLHSFCTITKVYQQHFTLSPFSPSFSLFFPLRVIIVIIGQVIGGERKTVRESRGQGIMPPLCFVLFHWLCLLVFVCVLPFFFSLYFCHTPVMATLNQLTEGLLCWLFCLVFRPCQHTNDWLIYVLSKVRTTRAEKMTDQWCFSAFLFQQALESGNHSFFCLWHTHTQIQLDRQLPWQ